MPVIKYHWRAYFSPSGYVRGEATQKDHEGHSKGDAETCKLYVVELSYEDKKESGIVW